MQLFAVCVSIFLFAPFGVSVVLLPSPFFVLYPLPVIRITFRERL